MLLSASEWGQRVSENIKREGVLGDINVPSSLQKVACFDQSKLELLHTGKHGKLAFMFFQCAQVALIKTW